ncbi:hypothetical protein [Cognatishimia sp. F0-27]|uniref:hypothetical protein n=1 Tax=Cognatishimia sp. F0-27 TaxID=2816855 RepID=UPI001D0CC537|nr:hypothetical protein [Cognatishimia sp. F0-27]MCC1492517.1 hypothetical protein [Cognatishimia sp. F0-27]
MAGEVELAGILCALLLQGEAEVRHPYVAAGERRHVIVDCETNTHVVEVGFDNKRSSFDSLHQALFAAELTGKLPMVVVIDTDGIEEAQQFQIESVSRRVGVSYLTVTENFLLRWRMTAPFRADHAVPLFGF